MSRRYPRVALFGVIAGTFTGFSTVALFGLTATRFQHTLQLSPIAVGFLVAMPALGGALAWRPFSDWAAWRGARKPFLILLGISGVGMAVLSLALASVYPLGPTRIVYPVLLLLALSCGAGIATFPLGLQQASYVLSPRELGWGWPLLAGISITSPGAVYLIWPPLLAGLGVTGSYVVWLGLVGAGTLLYAILGSQAWYFELVAGGIPPEDARKIAREEGQIYPCTDTGATGAATASQIWRTWAYGAVAFTSYGGVLALSAWLPVFWHSCFAVSEPVAGALTAIFSLAAGLTIALVGAASEHLRDPAENVAIPALMVLCAAGVLGVSLREVEVAVPTLVLLAIGMGGCTAGVCATVRRMGPQSMRGTAARVGSLGAFGGFAIPPLLGIAASAFGSRGYTLGFLLFVFLGLFSLSAAWVLKFSQDNRSSRQVFNRVH